MLTFRSSGVWGAGVGRKLTNAEIDGNFYTLMQQIGALIESGADTRSIREIDQSGANTFLITYTDDTVDGPFVIPTSNWNFRGEWTHNTAYQAFDVFVYEGGVYLVLLPYISPSDDFDPNVNDGSGHDLLAFLTQAQKGDTGKQGAIGPEGEQGVEGLFGVPGRRGRKGDPGLVWQGIFDPDRSGGYSVDDVVYDLGSSFVCNHTPTFSSPSESPSDWDVLASRGDDGDPGGPRGPAGKPGSDGADGESYVIPGRRGRPGASGAAASLTADLTVYVSNSGNDSNDGSISFPFLTIQHGVNYVARFLQNGFQSKVIVADGTYNESVILPSAPGFESAISPNKAPALQGTSAATVITGSGNVICAASSFWQINGALTLKPSASGTIGLTATFAGSIVVNGVITFDNSATGAQCWAATMNGIIQFLAKPIVKASFSWALIFFSSTGGLIQLNPGIDLSSNPTVTSAFTAATSTGKINCAFPSPGGTVTGKRFTISGNASIITSVARVSFPGSTPGTCDGSSFYTADGYVTDTPTTGGTVSMTEGQKLEILNPAGSLAALTVNLPSTPADGQETSIASTHTITALTIATTDSTTIVGAPSTIGPNQRAVFRYSTSGTKWYTIETPPISSLPSTSGHSDGEILGISSGAAAWLDLSGFGGGGGGGGGPSPLYGRTMYAYGNTNGQSPGSGTFLGQQIRLPTGAVITGLVMPLASAQTVVGFVSALYSIDHSGAMTLVASRTSPVTSLVAGINNVDFDSPYTISAEGDYVIGFFWTSGSLSLCQASDYQGTGFYSDTSLKSSKTFSWNTTGAQFALMCH